MSWIGVAVKRPVTVMMGVVSLVLFGLISLGSLQVNLLPELSYPSLTIRTEYAGAAPAEIETLLSRPIEESLGTVSNVRSIESVSRAGQSDVVLEFAWGTDMNMAGLDVREKLEVLQLPFEASRPALLRFNPATDPIVRIALGHEEEKPDAVAALKALRRHADEQIKKSLEPLPGVAAVKISGGLEDEIRIAIDEDRLDRLDLTTAELADRLGRENLNVSAGRLEDGNQRYLVRTVNQFASVDEIENLIVTTRDGQPIRLRDIAAVSQSFAERQAVIRYGENEAVEIALYKEGDANTVAVADAVVSELAKLRRQLPEGMTLRVVENQATFIARSIDEVTGNALLGGLLAMLVIFLFLRDWASTLIIAVSIPVSIIATFFLMAQTGISLNIMSLGGIALATGLLVDNAIVVLENIARQRSLGLDRAPAAVKGAVQVGGAVLAATLTTLAVFVPLAFVEGVAGQLFGDQALTVAFALGLSLLVAVTMIPMLAARLGQSTDRPRSGSQGGRFMQSLQHRYRTLLTHALAHRAAVLGVAALVLTAALFDLMGRDAELIPQLSQGRFEVTAELAPGTPLEQTDRIMRQIQQQAATSPGVDFSFGVAGSGNRIDASPTESGENISRILISLDDADEATEAQAMADLRASAARIPGAAVRLARPELLSFDRPLEIELSGFDLAALKNSAELLSDRLRTSDRFVDIESSLDQGHPEIQIRFDQERLAALGMTVRQASDQLVNTVRGTVATRYSWRDRKIDVLVRSSEQNRASIDDIRNLLINPASARPVTLDAVAEVVVTEGPAEIRRSNQERVAVISANLAYGSLSAAVEEAQGLIGEAELPVATVPRVVGQTEEMRASIRSLLFALGLAVFLVYLVMASQFESLVQPLVILFSIPLAAAGVALGLSVTGQALSVMVFIGLIMLCGIVVNNAIVLIDLVNQLRADGMERTAALLEAGTLRLRPILMTTLTTTLGLLPMALGLGEGAEIRAPMAVTVISGLLVSTLLTLVVIPVVYTLLDRPRPTLRTAPATQPA
jgi:HAE1 family hydrophobic/amphiphilic exporter-1